MTEEVRVTSSTGGQKGTKEARLGLIPPKALVELSRVYAKGAAKYDDYNWRKGYDWHLSFDALQRHLQAFWDGENLDPEFGDTYHLMHAAWHCFTLFTFIEEHPEFDDRWSTIKESYLNPIEEKQIDTTPTSCCGNCRFGCLMNDIPGQEESQILGQTAFGPIMGRPSDWIDEEL